MTEKLLKIYDRLSKAEQVREALLASGFPAENLHLSSTIDEAGPVEGNFALEYKDAPHEDDRSFLDSLFQRDDPNEGLGRQDVVRRGNFLLTVDTEGKEQFRRAQEIVERFGGIDPGTS